MCINVCVLIAKCLSQTLSTDPRRVPKPLCRASDISMSGKKHPPAGISTSPVLKAPFCCRCVAIHTSKMLLMRAQLCLVKKKTTNQLEYFYTYNFLWSFRVM